MNNKTIIIDTRERDPYFFDGVESIHQKLDTGDYSLLGYEHEITIERKNLNDWVSTIIYNQRRFRKELRHMAQLNRAYIIVEGSVMDIHNHNYHSSAKPNSVLGMSLAIMQQWGIPVLFACNRPMALNCTRRLLLGYPTVYKPQKDNLNQ